MDNIDFNDYQQRYGIHIRQHFFNELLALQPYVKAGLLELDTEYMQITAKGRLFVRAISMEFDQYLRQATNATYSKLI